MATDTLTRPTQALSRHRRITFSDVFETTRLTCAMAAWRRAVSVSSYRRIAAAAGRSGAAAQLGKIKRDAVRRAVELAPEHVRLRIDDDYQVGLLSVEWAGVGRLHLPAATDTAGWRATQQGRSE